MCFQPQNEMLLLLILVEMGAQFQYFALKSPVRVLLAPLEKTVMFSTDGESCTAPESSLC